MSKQCEICGKKPMTGNHVSHAHNVNKRRFNPNLQQVRAVYNGSVKKINVCTKCIKAGLVVKAPLQHHRGVVRFSTPLLGSDEWSFICDQGVVAGDRVVVKDISGNTLIVEPKASKPD